MTTGNIIGIFNDKIISSELFNGDMYYTHGGIGEKVLRELEYTDDEETNFIDMIKNINNEYYHNKTEVLMYVDGYYEEKLFPLLKKEIKNISDSGIKNEAKKLYKNMYYNYKQINVDTDKNLNKFIDYLEKLEKMLKMKYDEEGQTFFIDKKLLMPSKDIFNLNSGIISFSNYNYIKNFSNKDVLVIGKNNNNKIEVSLSKNQILIASSSNPELLIDSKSGIITVLEQYEHIEDKEAIEKELTKIGFETFPGVKFKIHFNGENNEKMTNKQKINGPKFQY